MAKFITVYNSVETFRDNLQISILFRILRKLVYTIALCTSYAPMWSVR
jgi:hypothetical protein